MEASASARIDIPPGDQPESYRLAEVNRHFGGLMSKIAECIYEQSPLEKRVREALRMRIAQLNQCRICLDYRFPGLAELGIDQSFYDGLADWKDGEQFSAAEKLAIDFAERFAADHLSIDDAFFLKLHVQFSNEEIFAMTSTVAGLLANGRILQLLQVEQRCTLHVDEQGALRR